MMAMSLTYCCQLDSTLIFKIYKKYYNKTEQILWTYISLFLETQYNSEVKRTYIFFINKKQVIDRNGSG